MRRNLGEAAVEGGGDGEREGEEDGGGVNIGEGLLRRAPLCLLGRVVLLFVLVSAAYGWVYERIWV